MRDRASDITKNMAGSLMGKITKGEGNTEEKAKKVAIYINLTMKN